MGSHLRLNCPACLSDHVSIFLELANVPVHIGSLWPSRKAARECPRGDMSMAHCHECQLVYNASFETQRMEYGQAYDNSLESSAVFMEYAKRLAVRLIDRHDLHDKTVMEIGCGKGAFIEMLCELGPNRGYGFDKTFDDSTPRDSRVTFIKEHFSEEHARVGIDFVCSRHVLEHIPEPLQFLQQLHRGLGVEKDTVLYIEVPEIMLILKDLSIWDLMYEHYAYYGHESLGSLLTRAGFEVLHMADDYGGQFLGVEARPSKVVPVDPPKVESNNCIADLVPLFARRFENRRREWQERLKSLSSQKTHVAVWGAGGKTVGFMNLFQLDEAIDTVVDINPRKQGHFLPGTGHAISPPHILKENNPDIVVVMNPVYREEIASHLNSMGLHPELILA